MASHLGEREWVSKGEETKKGRKGQTKHVERSNNPYLSFL